MSKTADKSKQDGAPPSEYFTNEEALGILATLRKMGEKVKPVDEAREVEEDLYSRIDDLVKRLNKTIASLQKCRKERNHLRNALKLSVEQRERLEKRLDAVEAAHTHAEDEVRAYRNSIKARDEHIARLGERISSLETTVAELARLVGDRE